MLKQYTLENIDHTIRLKLVCSRDKNERLVSFLETMIIEKSSGNQKITVNGLNFYTIDDCITHLNSIYFDYKEQGYQEIENEKNTYRIYQKIKNFLINY